MIASALRVQRVLRDPSVLLVVLGLFTLVADRATVSDLVERLTEIAPSEAATLFGDSLARLTERPSTGLFIIVLGLALAVVDDERDDELHDCAQPRVRAQRPKELRAQARDRPRHGRVRRR